jgi:hypothetical protein
MTLPQYTKKDLVIMLGVLIPWTFFLNFMMFGAEYFATYGGFAAATLITFTVKALSWQVHTLIAVTLRDRFPNEKDNFIRLSFSILLFLLITGLVITVLYWAYDATDFLNCEFYVSNYRFAVLMGSIVNVFVTFLHEGVSRFEKWRATIIENEQLKKEYMQSQLLGLKSQINPHFLFNSLNTLSCLIYEDENEAETFLNEMSKVYRYLLRNNEEELVTIETELQFIQSYFYLLKMRHGRAIDLKIDVAEEDLHKLVPPLTLQMLLENTFNNNISTKGNPIKAEITSTEDDWLVIKNNVHKKSEDANLTENLDNITKKFWLLCQKEVTITEDETQRLIKIPLINETKFKVA